MLPNGPGVTPLYETVAQVALELSATKKAVCKCPSLVNPSNYSLLKESSMCPN